MSIATDLESSSLLDEDCCTVIPDEFPAVVIGGALNPVAIEDVVVVGGVLIPVAKADVVVVVGLFETGAVELPGEVLNPV